MRHRFIPLNRDQLRRHNANRVIIHSDANCFYASCECLYNPDIRNKPVAVGGDPEARHGIILTKNYIAKRYGVQTGEALWQARQKCPGLVIIPAHYDLYRKFSHKLRNLYSEYAANVQSYGLDECWSDVTAYCGSIEGGRALADELRARVKDELGISVSVGVSNSMALAKLGSDMKKPDGTTVIHPDRLHETIGHLPVSDLLFCGPATTRKLMAINILTIDDLTVADEQLIYDYLGVNGQILQQYALGLDNTEISNSDADIREKSIGNSTTPPHDMENNEDVTAIAYLLAENISFRLRKGGWLTRTISLRVRTANLASYSCQKTLATPTNLTDEIAQTAIGLFLDHYRFYLPLRSLGIQCDNLISDDLPDQLTLFDDGAKRRRSMHLESTMDGLRTRFGPSCIHRGIVFSNQAFSNVVIDNNIGPASKHIPD